MKIKLRALGCALAAVLPLAGAGAALAASSPTVATGSASSVTTTSATLNGTVNPGGQSSSYHFEFGPTPSLGASTPVRTLAAGTSSVSVAASIGSLAPGTTYYFRLDATNKSGSTLGATHRFTTAGNPPPRPLTGPAVVRSDTAAVLTGTINPNSQRTTYYFLYGPVGQPTSLYVQTQARQIGPSKKPVPVSVPIAGLTPLTFFHYELVAVHGTSTPQHGGFQTFLTFPVRRLVARLRATTRPGRARRRPYAFTTSGRVLLPSGIPASIGCAQYVQVQFLRGRRQLSRAVVPVRPNCTFSVLTRFLRPFRHRGHAPVTLKVQVKLLGNSYLAPEKLRVRKVKAG